MVKKIYHLIQLTTAPLLVPGLFLAALVSRCVRKDCDIGLGPAPLINNLYHKKALASAGYKALTFAADVTYITASFDRLFCRWKKIWAPLHIFDLIGCYLCILRHFKALYLYFNGGPWGNYPLLWKLEPFLFSLAGIRVVVLPYGSDIQDMRRTSNWLFRDAVHRDYPGHCRKRDRICRRVELWLDHADHVIAGCDWIEYLDHWDTLMLAHFSIDPERFPAARKRKRSPGEPLRILHAPNHRAIKGTAFLEKAVSNLQKEGVPVELVILERRSNEDIIKAIAEADIVADQFIIGWYAMFALEAMAQGIPVLIYIRPDFERFYLQAGLLEPDELPFIKSDTSSLETVLRQVAAMPSDELEKIGLRSREFVRRRHSTEAVGKVFLDINRSLGLHPHE